jgi:hypothetical protein
MTQLTERDIRNAALRRAVAERQRAEWNECRRLAEAALGPGWEPWMKLVLVDSDHRRSGDETPVAVAYKLRKGKGDARQVRYLRMGPDGVIASEEYESLFGPLLTELHPSKTIEVMGKRVPVARWQMYFSALELYEPRSAEQLAAARVTRQRNKAERAEKKYAEDYPLFAEIERQEKEGRER